MRTRRTSGSACLRIAMAVVAATLLAACDFCEDGELLCSGNVVQECSSGNWDDSHDCGADTCGVGRDECGGSPLFDLFDFGFGEVWCCRRPSAG